MDREELKARINLSWRKYVTDYEVMDTLLSGDDTEIARLASIRQRCLDYNTNTRTAIDGMTEREVEDFSAETKYPTLENL